MRNTILTICFLLLMGIYEGRCSVFRVETGEGVTLTMQLPDGKTVNAGEIVEIVQTGSFKLMAIVNAPNRGMDTLWGGFEYEGYEDSVVVKVSRSVEKRHGMKDSVVFCYFQIVSYLPAEEGVELERDILYPAGNPSFKLVNHSTKTVYGYWRPDYLWGSLQVLSDGQPPMGLGARIDFNFIDSEPCAPGGTKDATVGSFGMYDYDSGTTHLLPAGRYRYMLRYSTEKQSRGLPKVREANGFEWYYSWQKWHVQTCEFEVK